MADPGVGEGAACCHELTQLPGTLEKCGHPATGPEALPALGNVPATCGQVSQSCAKPPRHQKRHEHGKANDEDVPP